MSGNVDPRLSVFQFFDKAGSAIVYQILPALGVIAITHILQWTFANVIAGICVRYGIAYHYAHNNAEIVRLITIAFGIFYTLIALGFDPTDVLLPLGVASLAFGYAAGPIFQNYFIGLIGSLFDFARIGLAFEVNGRRGILTHVGVLTFTLTNDSLGEEYLLPNSLFITPSAVAKLSQEEAHAIRTAPPDKTQQRESQHTIFAKNLYIRTTE